MRRNYIITTLLLVFCALSWAQTEPVDFSQTNSDEGAESDLAIASIKNKSVVLWGRNTDLKIARMKKNGRQIGTTQVLATFPDEIFGVTVVPVGKRYAIVVEAYNGYTQLYYLLISKNGTVMIAPKQITFSNAYHEEPQLATDGSRLGLTWIERLQSGERRIKFVTLSQKGDFFTQVRDVATMQTVSPYNAKMLRCDWNGSEYGVVWLDYTTDKTHIQQRRYNSSGTSTTPVLALHVINKWTMNNLDMTAGLNGTWHMVFSSTHNPTDPTNPWVHSFVFDPLGQSLVVSQVISDRMESSANPAIVYHPQTQLYWISWEHGGLETGGKVIYLYARRNNGTLMQAPMQITSPSVPAFSGDHLFGGDFSIRLSYTKNTIFWGWLRGFEHPVTSSHHAQAHGCTYRP